MRKVAIVGLLCLVPVFGCRGEGTQEGKVPIRSATPPRPSEAEPPESTQSLGDSLSALLDRFQEANAGYGAGEVTKEERTRMAEEFEQDAWSLLQGAKSLAEKAAKTEEEPKSKAHKQELEVLLLLYLEDLHGALCAERIALQTDKAQWNKRARLHTQPLPSLANSIRWLSEESISLPKLSPGPGKLPSPPKPPKQTSTGD